VSAVTVSEARATETAPDRAARLASQRPIWLCADDYGISPGVSKGIRDLVVRGRLNATSVMVVAPSFDKSEAASLSVLNAGVRRVAIGLHVTLTGPFEPMSAGFRPLRGGAFLPLDRMFVRGAMRTMSRERLAVEIATQLEAFVDHFGRLPDFFDGHQHVHLFPQVREALLDVVQAAAPRTWVRQCGRPRPMPGRFSDPKAVVLDLLSSRFRSHAGARGVATNPAFAGAYDFAAEPPPEFGALFPKFLHGMPSQGVVMCHPGFVDAELERLDPLTAQREREYAYLAGDVFPGVLRAHGVTLA
jgi:chitin disaccharide deacetylase